MDLLTNEAEEIIVYKEMIVQLRNRIEEILMNYRPIMNGEIYPSIKLIAHSGIDDDKIVKVLSDIGFSSYLLVGSDVDDLKKAIFDV